MGFQDLRSVKQLAAEHPAFTEAQLRWLIFYNHGGFRTHCVKKIGARVFIDLKAAERWLDRQKAS